mmetsp:Transcript_53132/g.112917  ORF Transcript_53132/g.112917 Transcript_53132/m.112917 type:complete len:257 (-) Transcript_53132:345-1115(-)
MKERVATSTCDGYEGRNISFMVWLFDMGKNYRHLFAPRIIPWMEAAHAKDKKRKTKKGYASKKRDHLRDACQAALQGIKPSDVTTIPVCLEQLDYRIFTRYLSTFKKKVKKRSAEGELVREGKEIRLSPSSFEAACSALAHLFTESGISKEKTETTKYVVRGASWCQRGEYHGVVDVMVHLCCLWRLVCSSFNSIVGGSGCPRRSRVRACVFEALLVLAQGVVGALIVWRRHSIAPMAYAATLPAAEKFLCNGGSA